MNISMKHVASVALLMAGLLAIPTEASAQRKKDKKAKDAPVEQVEATPAQPAEEEALPEITQECLVNVSLFTESAKNKQYADAVAPWYAVYETCPNANRAIYTRGEDILGWQISQAQTAEEKQVLKNRLMEMFDKRIKYFGNDSKYPTPYILGLKGLAYCEHFTEDALKLPAYEWLKQCIEGMNNHTQIKVINKFAELSNNLYKADPAKYGEQYIADYQICADLLAAIAANPNNRNANVANNAKDYIDNVFAASGAANCEQLDKLYGPTVQANVTNLEMLEKIMKLFKSVGCTNSEVYFAAAESAHKLQPTAESAAGCAAMSAKKGDYQATIAYYNEAFELSEDAQDKADYLYNNAVYTYQYLKQFSTARQYAYRSLEVIPDQGRCYMLIGLMYADTKQLYGNEVLDKTVYWVAVDKFIKARNVDPSVAEDANKMIRNYSKYFPSTEEVFFQPELGDGQKFTVGGWIGETTTCRASN